MTDKAAGKRYTYLTPSSAQDLLLYFDQGWSEPADHLVRLRTPIKVETLTRARTVTASRRERRAELESKVAAGEKLTRGEAAGLGRLRKTDAAEAANPERADTRGPVTEVIPCREGNVTIVGGPPLRRPKAERNPNLLAGRNRLFGAKTAQPAKVFADAVEDEVARRLAAMGEATGGATQPAAPPTPGA